MPQKKKVVLLATAAAAWAAIAEEAQQKKSACGVPFAGSFYYEGLWMSVERLWEKGRITEAQRVEMLNQMLDTFYEDARSESKSFYVAYYWPQTKEGWHSRVIAAQLLSEMSKDEGI